MSTMNADTRNWCSQCGQPYLDADWQPTSACGSSHAVIANELREKVHVALRAASDGIIDHGFGAHPVGMACLICDEADDLLSCARLRELCQRFGIADTDGLKHRLEDWDRWNADRRAEPEAATH